MPSVISKIKHIAELGASYALKLRRPMNPPYQFSIEATNRCNFKCQFCPQSNPKHKDIRPVGELTLENFQCFVKKVKEAGGSNRNLSICLDGEPLMNKAFPELIKITRQEGFFPRFSSNGRLLTPDMIERLAPYGFLASVDFSSDAEVFETIRGRKGDFEIILENLRYLVDKASKEPGVRVEIIDITHFSQGDAEASLKKMRGLFPEKIPPSVKFWSREFHNFGGHLDLQKQKTGYKLCPYPWTSFTATWDGNVVACCRDTEAKTILGNVFEQSVLEIWRGKPYQEMREHLAAKHPERVRACVKCDMPWSRGSKRWGIGYAVSSLLRR
ncbi:MAG TPA: radical SAM protein [Candidatus Hydrogenedentes bacterium]|nr:radical SAM protein [Candidatus Hydrogenedentota bacterium]